MQVVFEFRKRGHNMRKFEGVYETGRERVDGIA